MDIQNSLTLPIWICGKLSRELDRMLSCHRIAGSSPCEGIPKLAFYICFAEVRIRQQSGCSAVYGLKTLHGQSKLAFLDRLLLLLIFKQLVLEGERIVVLIFIDRGIDHPTIRH